MKLLSAFIQISVTLSSYLDIHGDNPDTAHEAEDFNQNMNENCYFLDQLNKTLLCESPDLTGLINVLNGLYRILLRARRRVHSKQTFKLDPQQNWDPVHPGPSVWKSHHQEHHHREQPQPPGHQQGGLQ